MRTWQWPTLAAVALSLMAGARVEAQGTVAAQLEIKKAALLRDIQMAKQTRGAVQVAELNPGNHQELFMLALAFAQPNGRAVARDLAKVVEAARVDKQLGSGPSASGSTSVASKGAVPKIFAFAVENGALTKTQSGTTISFKGNPAGIVNTLLARSATALTGSVPVLTGSLPVTGPLSRIALGVEFDASRGVAEGQAATFLGNQQQLAAASVKYEVLNHRDPTSRQFQARAERLFGEARSQGSTSTRAANQRLLMMEQSFVGTFVTGGSHQMEFAMWRMAAIAALDAARNDAELTRALDDQLALLSNQITFTADERAALDKYVDAYAGLLSSRDAMLALVGKGSILSFEFQHLRPVDKPTNSVLSLVYETSAFNGKWDLTANASATLFNGSLSGLPVGTDRLQEFAGSAQWDAPLGSIVEGRSLVFTLSGRAENKQILPTYVRDTIWLGQAKLTFPVKDGGIKVPLSVTFANRTDLIDEKIVRANVGFTFALDSLIGN